MAKKDGKISTRIDVIKATQTPLGFFALVVLVSEAVLALLASKATGVDFTILAGGMVGLLVLLVILVTYLVNVSPEALTGQEAKFPSQTKYKYDLYIASPMAAWAKPDQYKSDRSNALRIAEAFRKECSFETIFYMGRNIKSMADFDAPDMGVKEDLQIVKDSKHFVLLYPEKLASSVLVETGWALALRKPSIYFVRDRKDLPFLLRQAAQAFPNVRIYDSYTSEDEVIRLIHRHRINLFASAADSSTKKFPQSSIIHSNGSPNIVQAIKSPLGLFALVVLVVEVILGILASRAMGTDFTLLIIGMLATIFSMIVALAYLSIRHPKKLIMLTKQLRVVSPLSHDVYIASPMAAWSNKEEYEQDRINVLKIVDALIQECNFKSVFYIGKEIKSTTDFDAPDVGTIDNMQALELSRMYILLYPNKIVSSILVETGWALALNKPSVYFIRDRDDLPFLLRQAEQAFTNVRIYEGYRNVEDVIRLIERHKAKLFSDV